MSLDYSKIWATNGNTATITDEEYLEGFAFLLQAPPSKELFNKVLQLLDQKILALYSTSRGWKAGTSYVSGQVVTSSAVNDYRLMECVTAGVSGTAEPTWTDVGTNIADNTVTWKILDTRAGLLANRLVALDANAKLPILDGTNLTGLLKLIGGSITGALISTLVSGTAPIQVSSITLCNNLNADMVDGLHSTAFAKTTWTTAYEGSTGTIGEVVCTLPESWNELIIKYNWQDADRASRSYIYLPKIAIELGATIHPSDNEIGVIVTSGRTVYMSDRGDNDDALLKGIYYR